MNCSQNQGAKQSKPGVLGSWPWASYHGSRQRVSEEQELKMLENWNDLHLISDPFLRVGSQSWAEWLCMFERLKEALVVVAVS